jgi:hypothetical protein
MTQSRTSGVTGAGLVASISCSPVVCNLLLFSLTEVGILWGHMRRRKFIKVLLGSIAAWPVAVAAQEAGRTYRLGFLLPVSRASPAITAFFDELRANGFVEGQNLVALPGGFEVRNEQLPEVVATLIASRPMPF